MNTENINETNPETDASKDGGKVTTTTNGIVVEEHFATNGRTLWELLLESLGKV